MPNNIDKVQVNNQEVTGFLGTSYANSLEFIEMKTDGEGKIIEATKLNGNKVIKCDLEVDGDIKNESIQNQIDESVAEMQEEIDRRLEHADALEFFEVTSDKSEWLEMTTDNEGKIVEGLKYDGTKFIFNLEGRQEELDNLETELKQYTDEKIAEEHYMNVPDFYKDYIDNKIEEISQKLQICGQNGDAFVFITDTHWESNRGYSPSLINYIVEQTSIRKVFHGGDFIHGSFEDNRPYARDFLKKMRFTSLYSTFGNHDYYLRIGGNQGQDVLTTRDETYSTFFKHLEDKLNTNGKFYYYVDNPSLKIRYFVLDSHWPSEEDRIGLSQNWTEQLNWLETKSAEIGSEWSILVFLHIMFNGGKVVSEDSDPDQEPIVLSVNKDGIGPQLVQKLDSMYDMQNMPTIIGIVSGHTHFTYHEYSQKGYPIIALTDDGTWGWAKINGNWVDMNLIGYRPNNSVDAQSFNVFTIDKENRKLYVTRIGYGENQEFTY